METKSVVNPTSATGTFTPLLSTQAIDRYRTSSDASHFYLVPDAVATPISEHDIATLFAHATAAGTSITFRSGGTSLSGQAVSDAILVDTRRHFREIEVLDGGLRVRTQPGATVRAVNARLRRIGRKLGPDPASEIACTIGGVIANNSSGMACGITHNTYRTLQSATVVLHNGVIINTADSHCEEDLMVKAPAIYKAINEIHAEIQRSPNLKLQIGEQYRLKNTMGYGLNSFVDFSSAVDIFLHLMVGSEGTLGFVSEAIFETIPLLSHAATTLLVFENLQEATQSLDLIQTTRPATIELMDTASLRAGGILVENLDLNLHSALLVEYQAENEPALAEIMRIAQTTINQLNVIGKPRLSIDQRMREELWHIRKGLYAAVASSRRPGTTALLEDIAVPVSQLATTCIALQELFRKFGYVEAVIFGHAKDGNIHFLISEDFQNSDRVEQYRLFTEEMVDLVLEQGGSLKAEHGTGRMMAPFVERQFGPELYSLMLRIKKAFDPAGILNPGVIISKDTSTHLRHIKSNPTVDLLVDKCVECGYCEPICPSKDLTTTPRQRIVLQRALTRAKEVGNLELHEQLLKSSEYHVIQTCAVDGLCESSCPLGINTGDLVISLRKDSNSGMFKALLAQSARHWGLVTRAIAAVLSMSKKIPSRIILPINETLRSLLGYERVPLWSADLPSLGSARSPATNSNADFVFFPSCLGTVFHSESAGALKSLAKKAGLTFNVPSNTSNLCCGTPWKSKGSASGYEFMVDATYKALLDASDNGRIPIVCDASSCTEGIIKAISSKSTHSLKIRDSIEFTERFILPRLHITKKLNSIALHPTCSSTLLGINSSVERVAQAISESVLIPDDWGCCAFAGDRGMLHPDLTASATRAEAACLNGKTFDAYLSTNLTCEIGLSRATGESYQHLLYQLDLLSQAKSAK